jgi:Zinc carboxypeptidase
MRRLVVLAILVTVFAAAIASPALAGPVATDDATYTALGAVFPDPQGGCAQGAPTGCDPAARGNLPALSFIGYQEFLDGMQYMQSKPEWARYMEVWPLDGKIGDNESASAGTDETAAFPGNDLGRFEFTPSKDYRSAGLPTSTLGRQRSDMVVVRVTDETVPDAGKKRYALSLSIHGIERAGVEGGTRAIEDLVTTAAKSQTPILGSDVRQNPPSIEDVLKKTIIYFTYPNPDGWLRGSVSQGGFAFQRYNGNGVDVNRDWPDIGFSFRPYSGLSEPESRALSSFFGQVEANGGQFSAGDDLHGQPFADALSYTLLPHGRKDYGKDARIREAAKTINRAQYAATKWSPIIQANDQPVGGGVPCAPDTLGTACAKIYAQTWGTVYDTINYTTTGALGDWFDSSVGLGADGIDNEMSFSHLDRNTAFEPNGEQLHVAGNKSIIYAHLANIIDPPSETFTVAGSKGYVPNQRLKRDAKDYTPTPPPGSVAQSDIAGQTSELSDDGQVVFPFTVERGAQTSGPDAGKDVFNGGMRLDVTTPNLQGIGAGVVSLKLQCKGCDEHPGVDEGDEWITVQEDFNQSPVYLQSGVTVAMNRPQAFKKDGTPVEWRAVLEADIAGTPLPLGKMDVHFTQGRATTDGATGGSDPAELRGYDVANTDFFGDLNRFIAADGDKFGAIDPRKVIAGEQSLSGLRSLVLADDPLPGYTGAYKGEAGNGAATGPRTQDITFSSSASLPGAGSGLPGTYEDKEFTIGPNDLNGSMKVRIEWALAANDFDLFLYRKESDGSLTEIANSGSSTTTAEEVNVPDPAPGDYVVRVDNWAAADPSWTGTISFTDGTPAQDTGSGTYTTAEKDAFFAKLKAWVQDGGNLVLTDGALRAIGELTDVSGSKVRRQTVYAGQTAFAKGDGDGQDTLADPLAANVDQPGSRFSSGMRRQMYEPTPLGFSIQNQESGADESHARQYDIDRAAFEAAGGRVAGTSADAGDRDAAAVYTRVTLGEIPVGSGDVRVAGALLPQPTTEFDHPLGLEPYSTTYTGYYVMANLLRVSGAGGGGGGDTGGGGGGGTGGTVTGTGVEQPGGAPSGPGAPASPGAGTGAGGVKLPIVGCADRTAPRSSIGRTGLTLRGRVTDRACTARRPAVAVALALRTGKRCRAVLASGKLARARSCRPAGFRRASVGRAKAGKSAWKLRLRLLPKGRYIAWVRAVDAAGNVEKPTRRTSVERFTIK